jgi:hypothetical protein
MIRQAGLAIGVAVLIAVLGQGATSLTAFQHGWWVIAALSAAGIIPALTLLHPGGHREQSASSLRAMAPAARHPGHSFSISSINQMRYVDFTVTGASLTDG